MTTREKIDAIKRYYGARYFRGHDLHAMNPKQIEAIYERMLKQGYFERFECSKEAYVALFPNDRYFARIRADKMSYFELCEIIPKVVAEKTGAYPDGYQFTLDDILRGESNGNEEQTQGKK